MSESLQTILDDIDASKKAYLLNKKAKERDELILALDKAELLLTSSQALKRIKEGDAEKYDFTISNDLVPAYFEALKSLGNKALNDSSLDWAKYTGFIEYLPQSYVKYLKPLKIKDIKPLLDKRPYPINPDIQDYYEVFKNIIGDDTLRPLMSGVNFEDSDNVHSYDYLYKDDFATATGTNAHTLIQVTGKKVGSWSNGVYVGDNILRKSYKKLMKDYDMDEMPIEDFIKDNRQILKVGADKNPYRHISDNRLIGDRYPNTKGVSSLTFQDVKLKIRTKVLYDAVVTINKMKLSNSVQQVSFVFGEEWNDFIDFNSVFMESLLKSLMLLNMKDVIIHTTNSVKALVFTDDGVDDNNLLKSTFGLLMPMANAGHKQRTRIKYINPKTIHLIAFDSPAYIFTSNPYDKVATKKKVEVQKVNKIEEPKPKVKEVEISVLISELRETLDFVSEQEKKDTEALISDLELVEGLSSETIKDESPIKKKDNTPLASELPTIFEYDGEELSDDSAYLMTEEEYKEKVIPLVKEYRKFTTKKSNKDYLRSVGYGGDMASFTYEDFFGDKKEYINSRKWSTDKDDGEKAFKRDVAYKFIGKFDDDFEGITTPPSIIKENKDYQNKLDKFFTEKQRIKTATKDSQKSNKSNVRYAIDNEIYRKLLDAGKISVERVNEIADSVGIKLPKKVYDTGTQISMVLAEKRAKILKDIPKMNQEQLKDITLKIFEKLKPIEDEIYENEYKRTDDLLTETINKTYYPSLNNYNVIPPDLTELKNINPFWNMLMTYDKTGTTKMAKVYNRWKMKDDNVEVPQFKITGKSAGYSKMLSRVISQYVRELKIKLLEAIYRDFNRVASPIKSFDFVDLEVDSQGFQGEFKITFENSAVVFYNTSSIGAGGYNIQRFHYRYLTGFDLEKSKDNQGNEFESDYAIYKMK